MPDDRLEDCLPPALSSSNSVLAEAPAPGTGVRQRGVQTGVQQTLAMRITQRNLQRNERLARLRPAAPAATPAAAEAPRETASCEPARAGLSLVETPPPANDAALEEFLQALTGGLALPGQAVPAGAGILRFPEPRPPVAPEAAAEAGSPVEPAETVAETAPDLDRLPGAGPGLIWALQRAGIARLADLAPLEPADLAARLGPLGRLVPAAAWIAAARAAG